MVVKNGIDRDVDLSRKTVGIAAELADVVNAITGSSPGTIPVGTDVDSIGTVVDGCQATLQILSRCQ